MGIESSWFPGQFESSDSDKDKEDKDSRQKKRANAAPASRFEQPHSLNLTSQNQGQIELRPPRPPLLESLIHGQQKDQEITKAGLNLPLPGEAVTHPMEQGQPPEAIPNPELNQSNEDEDEDEEEDEKPIAQAPQAEQARPATFEEIMSQMGPEYVKATSHEKLDELKEPEQASGAQVSSETASSQGSPDYEPLPPINNREEESDARAVPPSAGGAVPPMPPTGPPTEFGAFDQQPEPEPQPAVAYASAPYNSPNWYQGRQPVESATGFSSAVATVERPLSTVATSAESAKKHDIRLALVGGFLTGWAVRAYIAHNRQKRFEQSVKKQFEQRNQQIVNLQSEQHRLREQASAKAAEYERRPRFEQVADNQPAPERPVQLAKPAVEVLPPVQTMPEQEIFDQEGNKIVLQPGWRVERSVGGYSVVLDEHNRIVHDAIRYGEAYHRDQKREQQPADLFSAGSAAATPVSSGAAYGGAAPVQTNSSAQDQPVSSYVPLPRETPNVDLNHRLSKPRNQVVSTLSSPWLWTAIAILLIVYFIAALA